MQNKKCPFCGNEVAIHKNEDGTVKAVCNNYTCPVESFSYKTEQEALEW